MISTTLAEDPIKKIHFVFTIDVSANVLFLKKIFGEVQILRLEFCSGVL